MIMARRNPQYMSKREKQIMDIVYRKGKATAAEVYEELEDMPSYSAARVMMHLLEEKGLLVHEQQGQRYIYSPAVDPETARRRELTHLVNTFFGGSLKEAMADLIDISEKNLSDDDWASIFQRIEEARRQGR